MYAYESIMNKANLGYNFFDIGGFLRDIFPLL